MIDYCKQFFGKSIQDLIFEDIEEYFKVGRSESTNIEFKSGQDSERACNSTLTDKIIKSICGFLNSEGGILIWGTPREEKDPTSNSRYKIAKGELKANEYEFEKDSLVRQIVSTISYLPIGIKVAVLAKEQKFVYVFEVQESNNKPHQYKNEYLIRIDGHTQAAPHFLIDSMFKSLKHPELEGKIIFSEWSKPNKSSILIRFSVFIENVSLFINETNIAYKLLSNVGRFQESSKYSFESEPERVLHYGRFILKEHHLRIDLPEAGKLKEIILSLTFGGEKGPSLISSYKIDPSKFKQKTPFDYSEYVVVYIENQNFKEQEELLGITREDSFESLINQLRPSRSKPAT